MDADGYNWPEAAAAGPQRGADGRLLPGNRFGHRGRPKGAIAFARQTFAHIRPALHQVTTPATGFPLPPPDPGFCVLLTMREVAARLKVSRAAIYSLVKNGKLGSLRVSNSIRIRRDDHDTLVR
jgi:excisionase family DNA binding protein